MKFVLFYHSLASDWNHGNAHFLRGIATELIERGHEVAVYEPVDGWSLRNLRESHGDAPIEAFRAAYPRLEPRFHDAQTDIPSLLDGADVVLVHEWNDPDLVARIGEIRSSFGHFRLLFHDTHHRALTARREMNAFDLRHYDGVLAYGRVLRDIYLAAGWTGRAWTWHEAADVRMFQPLPELAKDLDFVWIGNWGDNERAAELREFLIEPAASLGIHTAVHGVRFPEEALDVLAALGIEYRGWLPNFKAPQVFASARVTVHVPRRPYVEVLPGIPTIRPFEAMACGIPLVSAPWNDAEELFTSGRDYLVAENGAEMRRHLRAVLTDSALASDLAEHGLETIRSRHTCAHRVDELFEILNAIS